LADEVGGDGDNDECGYTVQDSGSWTVPSGRESHDRQFGQVARIVIVSASLGRQA
jgi:hypothetical protein